jgi:hypothetical protein
MRHLIPRLIPIFSLVLLPVIGAGQQSVLTRTGQVHVAGRSVPFLVRHLPVNSFPELPAGVATALEDRGCLIPQTYQAHRPENVIHASFERAGSSDWAALCSVGGTVSLLVFLGGNTTPAVLASASETERLQSHDATGELGFGWGIDPATPEQVYEAQAGMRPRPVRLDHDALADAFIDQWTTYHFFTHGAWTVAPTPE